MDTTYDKVKRVSISYYINIFFKFNDKILN